MAGPDVIVPVTGWELEGLIRSALDQRARIAIAGGNTKAMIGPQPQPEIILNLSSLRGVEVDRDGGIAVVQAGTPIRQLERELLRHNAMLAFEPPDFGPLFGLDPWLGTIGGAVLSNFAGARAITAGPPQRNLTGCSVITGHGDIRQFGWAHGIGRARTDMTAAIAGSWGMFGITTELAVRIVPLPEETVSLGIWGLTPELAVDAMTDACSASDHITGAVHVDRGLVPRFWSERISAANDTLTLVRCEARHADMTTQLQPIRDALGVYGSIDILPDAESTDVWSELQALSVFQNSDAPLWRLTVPPQACGAILQAARACLHCVALVDWAGGLIWLETDY
ncbi:MAG: FAD-binding protein, partial [Pseudomonadota bacterium]